MYNLEQETLSPKINKTDQPLITVITVVFNGVRHLEETIQSVISQEYSNIEYIIIDGGSTDGTLDIIKQYQDSIDSWVSEPDQGIYDAMNKGSRLANGSYISFLNASDIYFHDAIINIASSIVEENFDYCCGPVTIRNEENQDISIAYPLKNFCYEQGRLMEMFAPHLSVFIKTEIFHALGGFDLSFALSSDFDLLLRMSSKTQNAYYFDSPIGAFKLGGVSGSYKTYVDNFYVYKKHHVPFLARLAHTTYFLIRLFVRKFIALKIFSHTIFCFKKK